MQHYTEVDIAQQAINVVVVASAPSGYEKGSRT